MAPRVGRGRLSLSPGGSGVLSLFFPGLLIAAVSRQHLLVAVSVAAALVLVVDAVAARTGTGRVAVAVSGPTSTTAGTAVPITVSLEGPSGLECAVGIDGSRPALAAALVPETASAVVVFDQRRVVDRLTVRVRTAGPLGLVTSTRALAARLAEPLHVAPAPVPATLPSLGLDGGPTQRALGGDPIGLRPYAPGDPRRDVHWPSVARTGTLLVRDRRRSLALVDVAVRIDLGRSAGIDDALGRARTAIGTLTAAGCRVVLTTLEEVAGGRTPARGRARRPETVTVVDAVDTHDELLRRLARVAVGSPEPDGPGRRLMITSEGLWWQGSS